MSQNKTKLEILREIDKAYGLVNLFRLNTISAKIIFHKDVYEKYDTLIVQGYDEAEAKVLTAKYFKCNLRSVQRIIKDIK